MGGWSVGHQVVTIMILVVFVGLNSDGNIIIRGKCRERIIMKSMIFESELKVLEVLWTEGDTTAKDLAIKLNKSTAWSKTTTYTVIKKCIDKGLIERLGSNFTCRAMITREQAQKHETEILAKKMFGGSSEQLIASIFGKSKLTASQVDQLRNMAQGFSDES